MIILRCAREGSFFRRSETVLKVNEREPVVRFSSEKSLSNCRLDNCIVGVTYRDAKCPIIHTLVTIAVKLPTTCMLP